MEPEFDPNQPIYLQIMQRLCSQILRGDYAPGDKLPSLVDAGLQFTVNHNTIARVYTELARQRIVEAKRGEGTFVTEDRTVLDALHHSMRDSLMENFFTEMGRLGYSIEEMNASFQEYILRKSQAASLFKEKHT
jgi:DNA-binding transcriptional regulator YhcF (GntR family)